MVDATAAAGPRAHAQAAETRLSGLIEAVVAIGTDLDLHAVLRRIVESACRLVGARYGALGVLDTEGERLVDFVTHGVSDTERAAIGHLPLGHGLLGLIIRSPTPHRVVRIADHPNAHGFPPNHPTMTSFLGAPVRVADRVFGNLYLTDKLGADEFGPDDEAVLSALASAAGIAIEHARVYDRSRADHEWSEVARELVTGLLQGRSEDEVLVDTVEVVRRLADARSCVLARAAGPDLVVTAAAGDAAPEVGEPVTDPEWRRALAEPPGTVLPYDGGWLVRLGLDTAFGVLAIRASEREPWMDEPPLADFAHSLSVGLTAAAAQRERVRLERVEDHERIARDMHDHVIQRLFATGLSLQSTGRLVTDASARGRIETAVDEVDEVIRDIRHTIFGLHLELASRGLHTELADVLDKATVTLGFVPSLTVRGDLAQVDEPVATDLLAVVREALSNTARHTRATEAIVVVEVADDVRVVVCDDGGGIPDDVTPSGLRNLGQRARRRGGQFHVGSSDSGGARLEWVVPVRGTSGT